MGLHSLNGRSLGVCMCVCVCVGVVRTRACVYVRAWTALLREWCKLGRRDAVVPIPSRGRCRYSATATRLVLNEFQCCSGSRVTGHLCGVSSHAGAETGLVENATEA